MDYLERNPLPEECHKCTDIDCDVCDIALERWYLPHEWELRIQQKGLLRALNREQKKGNPTDWIERRIDEIASQLLPFTEDQIAAIEHRKEMSKELFAACIAICDQADDTEMKAALYQYFPRFL